MKTKLGKHALSRNFDKNLFAVWRARLKWFRIPFQSSFRPAFLFNEWSFKGTVRTNPKFLSPSIHDLHFLVTAGFLALVASKDAFDRTHKNIVFMEGFNVCVCPPTLISAHFWIH
jgi:hypothetical protein